MDVGLKRLICSLTIWHVEDKEPFHGPGFTSIILRGVGRPVLPVDHAPENVVLKVPYHEPFWGVCVDIVSGKGNAPGIVLKGIPRAGALQEGSKAGLRGW